MNNDWKETINFINSLKNIKNNVFTPSDIKHHIANYTNTINMYIRILSILGFIERIDRGMYVKVINIPENLSSSKAKKLAYSSDLISVKRYFKLLDLKTKIKENNNI